MAIPETRRTAPDGGDFADQLWKFQLRKEHAHLLRQYEDQCAAIEALENGNQEIITDANKRLQRRKEQEAKTKAMMDEMGAQLATLQKDIELLKEDLSKLSASTTENIEIGDSIGLPPSHQPLARDIQIHERRNPERIPPSCEEDADGSQPAIVEVAVPILPSSTELEAAVQLHPPSKEIPVLDQPPSVETRIQVQGLGTDCVSEKVRPARPVLISRRELSFDQYMTLYDTEAKKHAKDDHCRLISGFLIGLKDSKLKHEIIHRLQKHDPVKMSREGGRYKIHYTWAEFRAICQTRKSSSG